MIKPKRYNVKSDPIEGIFLTDENLQGAAEWCGGEVVDTANSTKTFLAVPSLSGVIKAYPDVHVLYRTAHGKFLVMTCDNFNKTFDELGVRSSKNAFERLA